MFDGVAANLVSTATGHLAFSITDLEISGAMPVFFQRVYASDRSQDTGLGAGWSFVLDDRITIGGDTATLSTGAGAVIAFRRDGQSRTFVPGSIEPTSHGSLLLADENTIVQAADGVTRTYRKVRSSYRLTQLATPTGDTIAIGFDGQGNITRLASSCGGLITLEWSGAKTPRLLSVVDNSKRRVSFKHDAARLSGVTDSAGAQWEYEYQAGRLSRAKDPLNRVLLRARYDNAGHVAETGDAMGVSRYDYAFGSGGVSRQTVITDPLGSKTTIAHTERGALASLSNNEGQAQIRIEYNGSNRPLRVVNALGGETRFSYDAQNRVTKQSSTDGTFQAYTYDERGQVSSVSTEAGRTDYTRDAGSNIILAKSNDSAQSYNTTRNSRGQLTRISSAAGSDVSFEHDASGKTSAFTAGSSGRFEIEYDSVGNVISRRLPSGALYRYEYDARGLIAKQSDGRGRSVSFERDASGAISGFSTTTGEWVRASRDQAGRITRLRNSAGKSRRFDYDARGALTDYTDARGKHKRVGYDRSGRVRTIDDEDGDKTLVARDESGRITALKTVGGKYRQPQDGEFYALKQRLSIANFLPTSVERSGPRAGSRPQDSEFDCLFNSDGFIDPYSYSQIGFDCNDPFGGFGSINPYAGFGGDAGGWEGDFDPFFGLEGPIACIRCVTRHIQVCVRGANACTATVVQNTGYASATCVGLAVAATGGLGLLLCLGLVFGGSGMGGIACQAQYEACLLTVEDRCPQCPW